MEDFLHTNVLMLMETCQHNIVFEVHMEDFYETIFYADADMLTQYPIGNSYGKFV